MRLVIFLFAYTAVRNAEENLGFSCAIGIAINIVRIPGGTVMYMQETNFGHD